LRDLTADEAKQLERICDALLQCKQQQPVQVASLRSALTREQYSAFKAQTRAPTSSAEVFDRKNRPHELTRYLALLKTADLTNARADRVARSKKPRRIGSKSAAQHWRDQSDYEYEHANECMEEILDVADTHDKQLIFSWLDRPFDQSSEGNIGIDCASVARVIGSRSKHCLVTVQTRKAAKKEKWATCAQDALQQAALQLIYVPVTTTDAQTLQLKAMLGKLKR
jgi:hypothetical protein